MLLKKILMLACLIAALTIFLGSSNIKAQDFEVECDESVQFCDCGAEGGMAYYDCGGGSCNCYGSGTCCDTFCEYAGSVGSPCTQL
jgi:hypothetical protein